jgi:uncharacterized delta-60 repeat protein
VQKQSQKFLITVHPLVILLALSVCLMFQNCSGFIVGNPITYEKTKLRFAPHSAKTLTADLCLTNVFLRVVKFTKDSVDPVTQTLQLPEAIDGGFDVSYFYYEPNEEKYYIRGFVQNRQIRLDPTGTLIGEFNLPHAIYDLVSFGFSPCGLDAQPSVKITNAAGSFADEPYKYFALPYYEERDLHNPMQNEFAIEYFTTSLDNVNSAIKLQESLAPYRNFDLIGLSSVNIAEHTGAIFNRMAEQSDGKTVAVGFAKNGSSSQVIVARFDVNGAIDPTFSVDGYVSVNSGGTAEGTSGIAIASDSSIFVNRKVEMINAFGIGILKLNPDGTPDTTWGHEQTGWVKFDLGDDNELSHDLLLLGDGSMLVSATSRRVMDNENRKEMLVFKVSSAGQIDTSFANNGFFTYGYQVAGYSDPILLKKDSNNKIVISYTNNASPGSDFGVIRLNSDGSLDTTFNSQSIATEAGTFIAEMGRSHAKVYDILVQPEDNNIVLVGRIGNKAPYNFVATRILANGSIDASFGVNGKMEYDFGGSDIARGVARRMNTDTNQYQILVSGQIESPIGFSFGILALTNDGIVDTSVANKGTRLFMFESPISTVTSVEGATMGGPILLKPNSKSLSIGGASTNMFHLLTVSD